MEPLDELLAEVRSQRTMLEDLVKENKALKEQLTEINNKKESAKYADGVPMEMRRSDPKVDPSKMQAARSVTIMTRPVAEQPKDYVNVVDPLSKYEES